MIVTMPVKLLRVWTMDELGKAVRMKALGVPTWNIARNLGRTTQEVRGVTG